MSNLPLLLSAGLLGLPLVMFGVSVSERVRRRQNHSPLLSRLASISQMSLAVMAFWICSLIFLQGPYECQLMHWFEHYKVVYRLTISLDQYSALFLVLSVCLSGIIGRFSLQYLAQEEGYYKFFINFYLMQFALYLLILSSNLYFVLIAWELLGLASVFLISFYQSSHKTVQNALFVLGIYKFCDLFLILALLTFHHEQHDFVIQTHMHEVSWLCLLLFLIASLGKSALFPFSKWVPRAMEGPTTSSAIFYGALSIHAGIVLLMKFRLFFDAWPHIQILIFGLGLFTALYASLKSRIQTDVKSTLAYATVVQVGFIYMEFALGWYDVVVLHTLSNAFLKAYQFTRSPSNIHHFHHLEKLNYQRFGKPGIHFEYLLPKSVRINLYKMVYHNFGLTLFWQMCLSPFQFLWRKGNLFLERLLNRIFSYPLARSSLFGLVLGLLMVALIAQLQRGQILNEIWVSAILLLLALCLGFASLLHTTIQQYLAKIKLSYFCLSASAFLFFGGRFHYDAVAYFVSNLLSLLLLDHFIRMLSKRLDLSDIRFYLGVGDRYKFINMLAISVLLLMTFTPGFASFVIFDVLLEDMSEKSRVMMLLFLSANTLNIYSLFKFMFKIIFGEPERYLHEYPDFTRAELWRLGIVIVPMLTIGVLPFVIFR